MSKPASHQLKSAEELDALAASFRQSRILLSAVELDFFSILEQGRMTAPAVAERAGADPRGVDRLLRACCAIGLLQMKMGARRDEDVFFNTEAGAKHLVRGKEEFLGALDHQNTLFHSWARLTDSVYAGGTVLQEPDMAERDAHWFEPFMAAMYARGRHAADALIARLDLEHVDTVLDVGGGPGVHAMAFARAKSGVRATVFDLPQVVPITRRYIEKDGMGHAVDTIPGNFRMEHLSTPGSRQYDLVFLSSIVHMLPPQECRALLQKAYEATANGGRTVVLDFIIDEARLAPPSAVMFALTMLVSTARGDCYTEEEVACWMREAGFHAVHRVNAIAGTAFIIGCKQE